MSAAQAPEAGDRSLVEERGRKRRLSALGLALDWRLDRLQEEYLRGSPGARADLAQLRRGLGKLAGSVPEIWSLTAVPESLSWDRDVPNRAEQAAHAALTIYALHQQSSPAPMHVRGVSFGQAAGRLAAGDGPSKEAVTRRFMAVSTANSVDEVLVHVRGLVTQLKSQHIGFDYAGFADDLHSLLTPGKESGVRIRWGRHFYGTAPLASDEAEESHLTEE